MGEKFVKDEDSVLSRLVPLKPLDLRKCATVSEIVAAMSYCAAGARMLGEAAETITGWINEKKPPVLIFDGNPRRPLAALLREMAQRGMFKDLRTSREFAIQQKTAEHVVVVGHYGEQYEDDLYRYAGRTIYINKDEQFKPGQARDGDYKDVVMTDPNLIMPILNLVIDERCFGMRHTVEDLMAQLETFEGAGKETVHGAYTLAAMLLDRAKTLVGTFSGALTIAKQQLLAVDLAETGRFSYFSGTGALLAHGSIEGAGCLHYKNDPTLTDEEMAARGWNRVSVSIEPETNFDFFEKIVADVIATYDQGKDPVITSSSEFHRRMGWYLAEKYPNQRSIFAEAAKRNIPVVTPAWTDSETANDVFCENDRREKEGKGRIIFDQERDTRILFDIAREAERLGIFTIGGGVPRNNTQNIACLSEIYANRLKTGEESVMFSSGCRIDPASMFLTHLGGCTYSEGASWRKFDPHGMLAEIRADATIVWAFIQKFALNRYERMAG